MNYARNIKTGDLVFFSGSLPIAIRPVANWAFWAIPSGSQPESFQGRFIGEAPDARCARLNHQPCDKMCDHCRKG